MKKLFERLAQLITGFTNNLRIKAAFSQDIVAGLYKVMNSSVLDAITIIFPGDTDDKLLAKGREYLAIALPYVMIVDKCKEHKDLNDMVLCFTNELRRLPRHAQDALLAKLAALLTALQDGKSIDGQSKDKARMSWYDKIQQDLYSAEKLDLVPQTE